MRLALKSLVALALALPASAGHAPPAMASCYKASPDMVRRGRAELWREHSLVFVGKVLEEGRTETLIEDPDDPNNNFGSLVTVQITIDRLEKGRAPRDRRVVLRYEINTPVDDVVGCSAPSIEPGQRRRFYLTPDGEHPGQYIGQFADPDERAR